MGAAVTQQSSSTIMAEITLANTAEGAEEVFLPGQPIEGEMPQQPGFLQGSEGKLYTFMPQDHTPLSQKTTEYFSETQQPKEQKSFNPKGESNTESKQFLTKEFQIQKSERQTNESKREKSQTPAHAKADQTGRKVLSAPRQHPPPTRPLPREMTQAKTISYVVKLESRGEKQTGKQTEAKRERDEKSAMRSPQQKVHAREQEGRQHIESSTAREQEKTDDKQEQQKRRDDQEEGFAEDDHRQKREEDNPNGDESFKIASIEKNGLDPEEVLTYAAEESKLLSELFNMHVNHFDVLALFIEVMKLSLKGREQERMSRMQERELQLQHIQNMVDNFKQQGKWMLFSNLGSGVLAIVSGISPIVGHMKGQWILDKLGGVFSSLQTIEKDKFFKGVTKMTFAMSEMYKSTGQIQNTFAESSRTYDQHMAEMRKSDWEEDTRSMDELKDQWKNMENFLHQSLQMYHDAIRQLYNN